MISVRQKGSVGMNPASAKTAVDPREKRGTWGLGILVTLLGKFHNIKGSPTVTRRKRLTKGHFCPSVSYKNDKLS